MKVYLCDPGVWKCPHGHVRLFFFPLSSESLSAVCLLSLRLNRRTWQRSADAPGSQDHCSEVLRLSIIKNSVRHGGAVIPSPHRRHHDQSRETGARKSERSWGYRAVGKAGLFGGGSGRCGTRWL